MRHERVNKLIDDELRRATEKNGKFNSTHEGYAILLEELEEAKNEMDDLEKGIKQHWENVKNDDIDMSYLKYMEISAINLIMETIQVAAMIKKNKKYLLEKEM
jgi:hypothetical protein